MKIMSINYDTSGFWGMFICLCLYLSVITVLYYIVCFDCHNNEFGS